MKQFIENKRRLGHGVIADNWIGHPSISIIVQADCLIVSIGLLSFRATTDCKL
jgi:hypothetical protein